MSVHIIKSWRTSQSSNFTVTFQFRPGMGYRFTTSWRESVRLLHSTVACTTIPFFNLKRLFSFRSTVYQSPSRSSALFEMRAKRSPVYRNEVQSEYES